MAGPVTCAICRGPTVEILNLGEMPLANGYAEPDRREPLNVRWCQACDFYQLGHTVAPETLFAGYAYRSGSAGQRKLFEDLATACFNRMEIDSVIDIGGNDGALLNALGGGINVDPYAPEQEWRVVRQPWGTAVLPEFDEPVRLITATNVWAHLPDLHDATETVAALLDVDGWFVVQAPWHRDLWLYHEYDTIYHEHRYYWGIKAMRALMQRHQMDVHDVEYLPNVHGGTLRYWIRHGNDGIKDSVQRMADIDTWMGLYADGTCEQERHKKWWCPREHAKWRALPQPIFALGAPAKATMYWAMTGTAPYVSRVFDDAQPKWGRRVPGTTLCVEPFSAFPADVTGTVIAMAWNAKRALTERVRALGYTGPVLTLRELPSA